MISIGYMGDGGGYSIGSQHLLNSAVRNEKVTLILVNNTNYGMTGGQMAPTTLPGQITETSPYGRDVEATGYPTRPRIYCGVNSRRSLCARATVSKYKQLRRFIRNAIRNQMEGMDSPLWKYYQPVPPIGEPMPNKPGTSWKRKWKSISQWEK